MRRVYDWRPQPAILTRPTATSTPPVDFQVGISHLSGRSALNEWRSWNIGGYYASLSVWSRAAESLMNCRGPQLQGDEGGIHEPQPSGRCPRHHLLQNRRSSPASEPARPEISNGRMRRPAEV